MKWTPSLWPLYSASNPLELHTQTNQTIDAPYLYFCQKIQQINFHCLPFHWYSTVYQGLLQHVMCTFDCSCAFCCTVGHKPAPKIQKLTTMDDQSRQWKHQIKALFLRLHAVRADDHCTFNRVTAAIFTFQGDEPTITLADSGDPWPNFYVSEWVLSFPVLSYFGRTMRRFQLGFIKNPKQIFDWAVC